MDHHSSTKDQGEFRVEVVYCNSILIYDSYMEEETTSFPHRPLQHAQRRTWKRTDGIVQYPCRRRRSNSSSSQQRSTASQLCKRINRQRREIRLGSKVAR